MIAPKVFTIIHGMELGKPYALPISRVGAPQGVTKVQRVEDMIKSECRPAIG
jgi:hypothetical protein